MPKFNFFKEERIELNYQHDSYLFTIFFYTKEEQVHIIFSFNGLKLSKINIKFT